MTIARLEREMTVEEFNLWIDYINASHPSH